MADNLLVLNSADVFSIYPKLFDEILVSEANHSVTKSSTSEPVYFPSDPIWQQKVYYRLLDAQKELNVAEEKTLVPEIVKKHHLKPLWDPALDSSHSQEPRVASRCEVYIETQNCGNENLSATTQSTLSNDWNLENISKAAQLLQKPPKAIKFNNELAMRAVYSLIYDVFRYKRILNEALHDGNFYTRYPELQRDSHCVCLLLLDLYGRRFQKRAPEYAVLEKEFYREANIAEVISQCLWDHRMQLAAALTRLRVKSRALSLAELLPIHLQNNKITIAGTSNILTGWINPFKIKDKCSAEAILKELGFEEYTERSHGQPVKLKQNQYKWDNICPLFLSCLPEDMSLFFDSELVQSKMFILQNRTFAIAPVILSQLVGFFNLEGDIVQTHFSSPRFTAYMAALFYSGNKFHEFLVFGAGEHLVEYDQYMRSLGVSNIRLYAETFCMLPQESFILENVVGIFATPPSSYSGVTDPIELICCRGGDLNMLEELTESEVSSKCRSRILQLLREQRNTLRLSMSRPQIQFILYETHSILPSENQDMVHRTVEDINRCVYHHHLLNYQESGNLDETGDKEPSECLSSVPSARSDTYLKKSHMEQANEDSKLAMNDSLSGNQNLILDGSAEKFKQIMPVAATDEFVVCDLPHMDISLRKLNLSSLGCFISLIRRKKITKCDAKYLIKMAEMRGLFGNRKTNTKLSSEKKKEQNADKVANPNPKKLKRKRSHVDNLIERLEKPTYASLCRKVNPKSTELNSTGTLDTKLNEYCERFYRYHEKVNSFTYHTLAEDHLHQNNYLDGS